VAGTTAAHQLAQTLRVLLLEMRSREQVREVWLLSFKTLRQVWLAGLGVVLA
jgi:flavin-dependent dehydrogenase